MYDIIALTKVIRLEFVALFYICFTECLFLSRVECENIKPAVTISLTPISTLSMMNDMSSPTSFFTLAYTKHRRGMTPPLSLSLTIVFSVCPLILIPWGINEDLVPEWIMYTYPLGVVICAASWEFYVTYGLAGGWRLKSREPWTVHEFPILGGESLNWVLMSSLDSLCLHGLMMAGRSWFANLALT